MSTQNMLATQQQRAVMRAALDSTPEQVAALANLLGVSCGSLTIDHLSEYVDALMLGTDATWRFLDTLSATVRIQRGQAP